MFDPIAFEKYFEDMKRAEFESYDESKTQYYKIFEDKSNQKVK